MKKKSKKIDIKYLGIPNICFSLTDKDDKRERKYSKQRMERGFDDSETWSLYNSISKFTLPRLMEFKKLKCGYPACFNKPKEWDIILDKMIKAFELINKDDSDTIDDKLVDEGLKLFAKWFFALWW